MNELDDLQIRSDDESNGRTRAGRPSAGLWLVLAGLVVGAGVAAWLWWPRGGDRATAAADDPTPAGERASTWEPVEEEGVIDPDLPPLGESDPLVRELVGTLSSHPNVAVWLVNDRLVDRFTSVVTNVAFDEDPRSHVPFLRPSGRFAVDLGEEGSVVIDQDSYARYDLVCDVIASLDTEGSVELYRKLLPLFQASYRELGMPGDFQEALRRAVSKVLETPVVPGELAVREETLAYRYQDPELEALAPAQKLLLRAGPRNVARVKTKVREIADAAGLL